MNELQLTSLESCLQWLPPLAGRTPLPRTPAAIAVESFNGNPWRQPCIFRGMSDGDQDKLVRPLTGALRG